MAVVTAIASASTLCKYGLTHSLGWLPELLGVPHILSLWRAAQVLLARVSGACLTFSVGSTDGLNGSPSWPVAVPFPTLHVPGPSVSRPQSRRVPSRDGSVLWQASEHIPGIDFLRAPQQGIPQSSVRKFCEWANSAEPYLDLKHTGSNF